MIKIVRKIVGFQLINTNALGLTRTQFVGHGHYILQYLFAEACHHCRIIIGACHAVIRQLHKVFVTQLVCNARAHLYQLVVNFIKLSFVRGKKTVVGLVCLFAHLSIGAFHKSRKPCKVQLLAIKIYLGTGHQFSVLRAQFVFFFQVFYNRSIESFGAYFCQVEQLVAEIFL